MCVCDLWIETAFLERQFEHPQLESAQTMINGHFRNLNWRYLPYVRSI